MTSTKIFPPSHATSQTGDPSARLSLAIMKLDHLIIRVSHIGTLTDQPLSETPHIQVLSKEPESLDTSGQEDSLAECLGHQLSYQSRLPTILASID